MAPSLALQPGAAEAGYDLTVDIKILPHYFGR